MKNLYQKPNIKVRHLKASMLLSGSTSISNSHAEQDVQYSKSIGIQDYETTGYPQQRNLWDD